MTFACPYKKNILVIDDDFAMRSLVMDAIEQFDNYVVYGASDGLEGLEKLKEKHFDLVVCDVMMPGINGMDILERINNLNPSTRVILMTAYPSIDLSVSAIKTGAVDFLVKPINIDDLIFKIDVYLRTQSIIDDMSTKTNHSYISAALDDLSTRSYIYDSIECTNNNDHIFQEMASLSLKVIGGESCMILLYDKEQQYFNSIVTLGSCKPIHDSISSSSLQTVFQETINRKEALLLNFSNPHLGFSSAICAPLKIREQAFGVILLSGSCNGHAYTERDLYHLQSIANRASLNIENRVLYESVYGNLIRTFESLATSIQARDHYTEEHSIRVRDLAVKIAENMSIPPEKIESLKIAAMLHDIGKIAVPDKILLKPGRLSDEEMLTIKNHPITGEMILKPLLIIDTERIAVRHHHERWDGRGYPDGLRGEEIPLLSRILAVADSFDAMTNNRPYRNAMTVDKAVFELRNNSNLQFDEIIVRAFMNVI